MLINPFLTVENQNGVYYFSEKYGKTKKPFLTLQSKRELADLINDRELNKKLVSILIIHLQFQNIIRNFFYIGRKCSVLL